MRARELALEAEVPVVLAVRLRLERWRSRADAMATIDACVPGALLVCADAAEAELLTGERDPERAALALRKAGARLVLIALGADGAILRGEQQATVPGPAAGADALSGVVLGRLALAGYYPERGRGGAARGRARVERPPPDLADLSVARPAGLGHDPGVIERDRVRRPARAGAGRVRRLPTRARRPSRSAPAARCSAACR